METIRKIRCAYHRDKKKIRQIAREFNVSKNTVKKVIRGDATEFVYDRKRQTLPKLGPFQEGLLQGAGVRQDKAPAGAADSRRAL